MDLGTLQGATIDEGARRRFEAAWQSGRPLSIEECVKPGRSDLTTLEELVAIDLEFSWKQWASEPTAGKPHPGLLENYFERFPVLRQPDIILRLAREELRVRHLYGDRPDTDDYRRRFPDIIADASKLKSSIPALAVLPDVPGYTVEGEIARGAMGVVYRARHQRLNRAAAIKMIRGQVNDSSARIRFMIEAEAVAALDHPNIVGVYDFGTHNDLPFIAMEYVGGGTLASKLLSEGIPSPQAAAELMVKLAEAVAAAHAKGIVHRDLKPANILLTETGEPKVTDFGLAKVGQSEMTATGAVLGTPSYMSPEQASGRARDVGTHSDVHALGAILYEFLTGVPPFRGDTVMETMQQVLNRDPVPPRQLVPTVPRDLETICLKCLTKEPRRRYSSAQSLADDLKRYLNWRPIHARRSGIVSRSMQWCQRNPALACTILAAASLVAAVSTTGLYQVLQERERYRAERDRAQKNLYLALVGEARALIQARDIGWWWKAMDNIRKAGTMEVPDRDQAELRDLAIECMGSEHVSIRLSGTWEGHTEEITGTAFNPSGNILASGSRDRTVRLWAVPDGRPLAVFTGHSDAITGVVFHPSGKWLASSSKDGTVRVWDVSSVTLNSAQGTLVPVEVYDLKSGPVNAIDCTLDGLWFVAGCEDGKIHQVPSDPSRNGVERRVLTGHTKGVTCLAFSDSGLLASGSHDETIRLWDWAAGKEIDLMATGRPSTLTFDGNGLWWAVPETYSVARVTLSNGRIQDYGLIHTGGVRQLRRPAHYPLCTASADGTIKLWNNERYGGAHLREEVRARGAWGEVRAVALNREGNWIAGGYGDGRVRLWELAEPPHRIVFYHGMGQNSPFVGGSHTLATPTMLYDVAPDGSSTGTSFIPEDSDTFALHPAGTWCAWAEKSGQITLGNLKRSGEKVSCIGHRLPIAALGPSPDGKYLASASADGTIKLWEWASGNCRRTLDPGLGPLHDLAWSGDSGSIAVTGDRGVAILDLGSTGPARSLSSRILASSAISVSGDLLATSGADGSIEIREFRSGRLRYTLDGHKHRVTALAFSPDGKRLASAAAGDPVWVWHVDRDFAERDQINLPSPPDAVSWLAFDPRGQLLAGGFSGSTHVWEYKKSQSTPLAFIKRRLARFSPEGLTLITASRETIQEWSIADMEKKRAKFTGHSKAPPSNFVQIENQAKYLFHGAQTHVIYGVAASPDGRWIATASADGTVNLWNVASRKLERTFECPNLEMWCVAFSPDSRLLVAASNIVAIWEIPSGKQLHQFPSEENFVYGVAFHPGGHQIAFGDSNGDVYLWDFASGLPPRLLQKLPSRVYKVAYHPSGRWLVASGTDTRVALWDLADLPTGLVPPTRILEGHATGVYSVGFSADGRYLASGSEQGTTILWDGQTFERIVTLRSGTGQIREVSFSRDGRYLATAAYYYPTIVWDLKLIRGTLAEMNLDWRD